ncbi:MAG: hypothetical protein IPN73_08620 [Saprospiraceae bacterium]|nr:hypothetical protein [Saprospiraceae bacterium]
MKSLDFYTNGLKLPASYNMEVFTVSSSLIIRAFDKVDTQYNFVTIRFNKNYESLDSVFAAICYIEIEEIIIPLMVKHSLIGKEAAKRIEGNFTIYLKDYKEYYPYEQHNPKYFPRTTEPNKDENLAIINFNIEKALTFFTYFNNNFNLFNELKDLSFEDLHKFISPLCCHHRYAVLLYLTKGDWISYLDGVNEFYEQIYTENKDEYTHRFLKIGVDLKKVLLNKTELF